MENLKVFENHDSGGHFVEFSGQAYGIGKDLKAAWKISQEDYNTLYDRSEQHWAAKGGWPVPYEIPLSGNDLKEMATPKAIILTEAWELVGVSGAPMNPYLSISKGTILTAEIFNAVAKVKVQIFNVWIQNRGYRLVTMADLEKAYPKEWEEMRASREACKAEYDMSGGHIFPAQPTARWLSGLISRRKMLAASSAPCSRNPCGGRAGVFPGA